MKRPPPLHKQLRAMREKRGMTIEQVAKKLKWSLWFAEAIEKAPESNGAGGLRHYLRALNCHCIINGPDGAFVVVENQDVRR